MISCKLSHTAFINWTWLANKPPYPDRRFDLGSGPSPQSRETDPMLCFAKKHKRWNAYFNNVSSPLRGRHSHPGSRGFCCGSFGQSRLAQGRKMQRWLPAFLLPMSSSWPQVSSIAAMFASLFSGATAVFLLGHVYMLPVPTDVAWHWASEELWVLSGSWNISDMSNHICTFRWGRQTEWESVLMCVFFLTASFDT